MDGWWWRPLTETGGAAIIHVDLGGGAAWATKALEWLDDGERARCRRYRYAGPRREFSLCRAALRAVLCRRLGCRNDELAFETSSHGKPSALVGGTPAPLSFNVSHSGSHGLIALAERGRVGVDVEERIARHDPDGPMRTAFSPVEQAELAAASGARKVDLFLTLWTMKEALLKALGVGLSLDTAGFDIPEALRRGSRTAVFRFPSDPAVGWRLDEVGTADFAAAVAHELERPYSHRTFAATARFRTSQRSPSPALRSRGSSSRSAGPRLRSPWSENRSGASGTATKFAAIMAARLIAPRLGPTSISTSLASCASAACRIVRWNADSVRNAASSPSRHAGHAAESLASNRDSPRSPTTRPRLVVISST